VPTRFCAVSTKLELTFVDAVDLADDAAERSVRERMGMRGTYFIVVWFTNGGGDVAVEAFDIMYGERVMYEWSIERA
jgi:hypothetical protein